VIYDCTDPAQRQYGLDEAAAAVRRGDVVVLPTDTLYGIGCDAFSPLAVDLLLAAKHRGRDMPVPVLVGSWSTIDGLADHVTPQVRELVKSFWPGALTLVVRHAPSLAWDLGDAAGTVALRMPLHPVAIELLRATGPMAVSSANVSGRPPATTVTEAQAQLGSDVSVYLDGGPCPAATPSTIVDCTTSPFRVLRAGAVPLEQLREVVPDLSA
jgi:tRNA threonylcarbamoyl adenosine modification protein (Sua5/YciO/YrdC/YwlC family)